jgi:hypothetical protein
MGVLMRTTLATAVLLLSALFNGSASMIRAEEQPSSSAELAERTRQRRAVEADPSTATS